MVFSLPIYLFGVVSLLVLAVNNVHSYSTTTTPSKGRRAFFSSFVGAATTAAAVWGSGGGVPALAAQEEELRQGIKVDAFNGLIFNVSCTCCVRLWW